jgi:hypothetical protein
MLMICIDCISCDTTEKPSVAEQFWDQLFDGKQNFLKKIVNH